MNWTCTMAAKEFGVSRETVIRGLRGLGHEPKQNDKFTTRDIHRALAGDLKAERAREARANADLKEMEIAQLRKELVPLGEVETMLADLVTLPVRQWLLDQPSRMSSRCNAEHPEIAHLALKQDGDDLLKMLRDKLPRDKEKES